MKIQIDFPENYDKALQLYQITNDFKTKAEAVVDLAIKKLEPERKAFSQESNETKTKVDLALDKPEW